VFKYESCITLASSVSN